MPSRRTFLVAGGSLGGALSAGCVNALRPNPSVRQVKVLLQNGGDDPETFRYAFETGAGSLDWASRTIDSEATESVTIDPPPDSKPVAFHGAVDDRERVLEFDDLDGSNDEVCLYLYFSYRVSPWNEVSITRDRDTECY